MAAESYAILVIDSTRDPVDLGWCTLPAKPVRWQQLSICARTSIFPTPRYGEALHTDAEFTPLNKIEAHFDPAYNQELPSPQIPWYRAVAGRQWKILLAAQAGWTLDGMDVMLYAFALTAIQRDFALTSASSGALASFALLTSRWGACWRDSSRIDTAEPGC